MWEECVTEWYKSMVHPSDWMGGVHWSCMHVSCMCVFYTCISCACSISLMIDYGCTMVVTENLILISGNVFVISMCLVAYGLYVAYMLILCRLLTSLYVRLHS